MKKLISLVLALAMIMMVAAASAATITINQNPDNGTVGAESYNLYKIFDVTKRADVTEDVTTESTLGTTTATGFSYTISTSNPWFAKLGSVSNGVWSAASGQTWVTLVKSITSDTLYNVTWVAGTASSDAKAFAKFLLDNKGSISADDTMTSNASGVATETVADGYWLIDSTLGTNLVLATSNITINTKNSYPTTEKEVEHSNYTVGEKVKYTITVNLPATVDYTKDVTVHDTMDNVLAVDADSVHAKVTTDNDFDTHITYVPSSSFSGHDDNAHPAATGKILYDFVLDIDSLAPATGETATVKTITITYEAELLSTALADTGYINKEFVEYSEYKTPEDDTEIKTFDFDLDKTFAGIAADDQDDYEATFALFESDGETVINLKADNAYVSYVVGDSDDGATTNTFMVKGGTTVNVRGLKAGTYKVKETATSNGFNTMTDVITVTISDEGAVSYSFGSDSGTGNIPVVNQSGTVLPSTGGIGTTVFYIVGGLLLVGAAIVLVARRKASN